MLIFIFFLRIIVFITYYSLDFEVYILTISTCVVEPYNGLLATHWLLNQAEVSYLLINEGIYKICQKQLDIARLAYGNFNRLIARVG